MELRNLGIQPNQLGRSFRGARPAAKCKRYSLTGPYAAPAKPRRLEGAKTLCQLWYDRRGKTGDRDANSTDFISFGSSLLGGVSLALVQETEPSELLKTADEMIQVTAQIRGLVPKAPIARGVKSRAEISQYLNQQIKENYNENELLEEGKYLRISDAFLLP